MNSRGIIHRLWLISFALSLAGLPFSQTYSQIFFALALPLFVIDNAVLHRFTLSVFEKTLYLLITLFVLLEIISALSSATPLRSLWLLREEWLFLLLPVSLRAFRSEEFRTPLLKTILFSVAALAAYGIIQHYTGINVFHPAQELYQSDDGLYRTIGNFHNTLTFGNFMAVSAMFLLALGLGARRQGAFKALLLSAGTLASAVTLFSYQRGSTFGLLIGAVSLTLLGFQQRKWLILLSVGAVITVGALLAPRIIDRLKDSFRREVATRELSARDYSLRRTTIWKTSLSIIADNPLLGVGAGNFEEAYKHYADSSVVLFFSHAHNDLLNMAAYSGIPTVVMYGLIWFFLFRELFRVRRRKNADSGALVAVTATLVASITFLAVSATEVVFAKEAVRSALMVFWGYGLWGLEKAAGLSAFDRTELPGPGVRTIESA